MDLLEFGQTNIRVSKIGLGLAALGRPGYINLGHGNDLGFRYEVEAMQRNAMEVLDTAYASGIRYFDVARSYGKGEEFLANWLRNRKKEGEVVVGSKWGYTYTADWEVKADQHEVKEHSPEVLNRQWPISRNLLGEYLKIYHIHSATLESGVLQNKAVLDRLWELKNSGVIIGLSLSGENQKDTLAKAISIQRNGDQLFQSVQATWNILEPSATTVLEEAAKKGFGIIIKEALANGRLTDRNRDPEFAAKKKILAAMAEKYGVGIDAISLAYVLNQEWVNVVLSGASTKEQLLSNVKGERINLSESDAGVLKELAESPADYWKTRSALEWN